MAKNKIIYQVNNNALEKRIRGGGDYMFAIWYVLLLVPLIVEVAHDF